MKLVRILARYTLNNVIFGITLMVLIAAYIAIGSGVPSVREFFEMNELEFFDAWPLKLMMFLLCANLVVVTLNRIPLTPPRYGVWCIHSGIIVLIVGTSLYYHLKVEGRTLIPLNHTANVFYDSGERALYVRVLDRELYGMAPLPSLPRFGAYDSQNDPQRLRARDLTGIEHLTPIGLESDSPDDLASWLGVSTPVTLDVVGFYSYADVVEDVIDDPASKDVGVEVDAPGSTMMLTTSDPTASHQFIGDTELDYRNVTESSLSEMQTLAGQFFEVTAELPKQPAQKILTGIGRTEALASGGYSITIESYNPAFPMFGTHEEVQAMTLHIIQKNAGQQREFWRMILRGRSLQTDFKMDPATTPPMVKGNRQKEPIDKDLVLSFRMNDPGALLPTATLEKHVLMTVGAKKLVEIHTSFSQASKEQDLSDGGQIEIAMDSGTQMAAVRRRDHFRVQSHVEQIPAAKQIKDQAESGIKQVAIVRVKCGQSSQDVAIPCNLYAAPDPMTLEPMVPWSMGIVRIPGASAPLQLQLGFTCRPMPAALTLKRFDLVHYSGGVGDNGPYRDFRSTLEVIDPSGERDIAVASLNNPIYFDGGSWIFFQAAYDPDGQSSTIGVGNRPGVYVMFAGCVMIVAGLIYAFYVKPIVIRHMKTAALARAKKPRTADVELSQARTVAL